MAGLQDVSIILVRPRIPENIGSTVRVAANFGISSVILVRDKMPNRKRMAKTATHNTSDLLETMPCYASLPEALQDFNLVVGTTARRGRQRFAERSPKQVMEWLRPQMEKNRVALLFGPEDSGLSNDDLKLCQITSAIPTDNFSSLNLAQAVAIHCYELFQTMVHEPKATIPNPTMANSRELESMYASLEEALFEIDFLNEEEQQRKMGNLRNFFARRGLESRDTQLIRSICRKVLFHRTGSYEGSGE